MTEPTLVIMAAGLGSRYGGLKQIDPVGPHGELIIDYSIYDALSAGFKRLVFILRREIADEFHEVFGKRLEKRAEIHYVFQELNAVPAGVLVPENRSKPWGTGHAVWCCREAVDGPFAVVNADDFYGAGTFRALSDHLKNVPCDKTPAEFAMVGFVLENTLSDYGHVARGVCRVSPDGFLEEIRELTHIEKDEGREGRIFHTAEDGARQDLTPDTVVSMNAWGFTPQLFPELEARFERFLHAHGADPKKEFFIPEVAGELLKEGRARVKVLPTKERWFGVTYKEDRAWAEQEIARLIAAGVYPENLWG